MLVLPFSKMLSADVNYFLRYSIEAYFAPDEIILPPADGMPEFVFDSSCELLLGLWGGTKKEASRFQELKNLEKQGAWIPRG